MKTLLLTLKILGIIISGASIIGLERLKAVEDKIRAFLEWENIDSFFNRISSSSLLPLSTLRKKQENLSNKFSQGYHKYNSATEENLATIRQFLLENFRKPTTLSSSYLNLIVSLVRFPAQLVLMYLFFALNILIRLIFIVLLLIFKIFFTASFMVPTLLSILVFPFIITITLILKSITWVVTRPYIWLDVKVQKWKIESTIVVIGILMAVFAEILGYL